MDNKLTIRTAEDSDQTRWDQFVLNHPGATPYHMFAWKKAVEEAYGHRCYYLCAELDHELTGVLPLIYLSLVGLKKDVVGLPFCDIGNCIVNDGNIQDSLLSEAANFIRATRAKNAQIRGDLIQTTYTNSLMSRLDTGKVRMLLELPTSSDKLFKIFPSKLRSQIRKSTKNGVTFRWGGLEDFDAAYHVFAKNMHELGSPVHSRSFLKAVISHYGDQAKIGITEYHGKTIGMGIILTGGRIVCIPWASCLREFNRLGPNMLLYWNFLKFSADEKYACFDFGRSTIGEGTYKFKLQWGAKPIPLIWYEYKGNRKDNSHHPSTDSGKREVVAAIWQKLPLGVANAIGPRIRKYISL